MQRSRQFLAARVTARLRDLSPPLTISIATSPTHRHARRLADARAHVGAAMEAGRRRRLAGFARPF